MADLHSAVELGSCKKVPPGLQELDFRAAEELALFRLALGISPTEMDALTHLETNGRMDLGYVMLPKNAMLWSCEWEIPCYSSSRSLHALTSPESPRSVRHQQV